MTFVAQPSILPNTPKGDGRTKHCTTCDNPRPLAGGVQVTAQRWTCASCWVRRTSGRKLS